MTDPAPDSSAAPAKAPPLPTIADAVKLAVPASLASMATPLLGLVDVWALGRSDNPLEIAAVGLGGVIFSLVYWTFGFIRMGVAGLTAQAHGRGDEVETRALLMRGLILGGGFGLMLALLQWPIGQIAFHLLAAGSEASRETFASAETYYAIRIWGAPFAIATYALFGWLTARSRTNFLMIASLSMTAINIALDYWFVVIFDYGAGGVAAGTLIAEIAGALIAGGLCLVVMTKTGGITTNWSRTRLIDPVAIRRMLNVNFDIFIRTLLLAFSFAWFVQRGGAFGDVTLAANQTLLQLFLLTGLALDGTAIAAETMVGQAYGRPDAQNRIVAAIRVTSAPALGAATIFTIAYAFFGKDLLELLAPGGGIAAAATAYLPWLIISPLIVVAAFQLDGIFIGATRSKEMRNGMIICALALLPSSIILSDMFGNQGLWAAFTFYFVLRALTLAVYLPRITRAKQTA